MKKAFSLLMTVLVCLGLFSGLFRAELMPKQVNTYELRYARQLPALQAEAYASGVFQNDVEEALSDQFPLSQYLKKAYNLSSSAYLQRLIGPIAARDEELVVRYNGYRLYRGSLLYSVMDFEKVQGLYDILIDSYNRAVEAIPETAFYFYFIETDAVCDLIEGRRQPVYEYLQTHLRVPGDRVARLELRDFRDFQEDFQRFDHHWNARGSYRGYREILQLLGVEEEPLLPAEERNLGEYTGQKAASARLPSYTEPAEVWFFDYPDLGRSYGNEALYRSGVLTAFSYGEFYGGDEGELIFDTGRPERGNLLVIGDSYDNAILKLLASHFGKTCSIDLRYYLTGEDGFDIAAYIRRHEIGQVLVVGSTFLYRDPTFAVRC